MVQFQSTSSRRLRTFGFLACVPFYELDFFNLSQKQMGLVVVEVQERSSASFEGSNLVASPVLERPNSIAAFDSPVSNSSALMDATSPTFMSKRFSQSSSLGYGPFSPTTPDSLESRSRDVQERTFCKWYHILKAAWHKRAYSIGLAQAEYEVRIEKLPAYEFTCEGPFRWRSIDSAYGTQVKNESSKNARLTSLFLGNHGWAFCPQWLAISMS